MKIAVVTDSTAYIPSDIIEKFNIFTIPLSVNFEDDSYLEGIEISTEKYYEKLKDVKKLPTTSQPSIGMFIELYEKLAKDYDAVISVHLSRKISGTYDAATAAGKMVENIEVYPIDTGFSAMPQGFNAIKASEMILEGHTPEEIVERLAILRENTRAYFMVDDLTNLQKGGRLTGAQKILGSLLSIKPVLHMPEGEILPFEKIRTKKKALKRILELLEKDIAENKVSNVVFIHANDEAAALELQEKFVDKHPEVSTMISYFGPVIGTHLGQGALGVTWFTE